MPCICKGALSTWQLRWRETQGIPRWCMELCRKFLHKAVAKHADLEGSDDAEGQKSASHFKDEVPTSSGHQSRWCPPI